MPLNNSLEKRSEPINKKTNYNKAIIGTGTNFNLSYHLQAPETKLWIYVGRCKPSTTAEDVKEYLSKKSPCRLKG